MFSENQFGTFKLNYLQRRKNIKLDELLNLLTKYFNNLTKEDLRKGASLKKGIIKL